MHLPVLSFVGVSSTQNHVSGVFVGIWLLVLTFDQGILLQKVHHLDSKLDNENTLDVLI